MGLRLKFNLVLLVVCPLGLAITAYVSWTLLQRNAREEVVRNADLMMEAALAIRAYTVDQVRPQLDLQLMRVFLPQSVPAYAATETLSQMKKKYVDYSYKEATLNPTNPRNRAADWEADLVHEFKNRAQLTELIGERDTPTGRSLYIARPIKITNPACLPHDAGDGAAHDGEVLWAVQRLRLEAERHHRRPGGVRADGRPDPECPARVPRVHGLARRGVRARVRRAQRDAEPDDRAPDLAHVARRRRGEHGQLRHRRVRGYGPGRDRRAGPRLQPDAPEPPEGPLDDRRLSAALPWRQRASARATGSARSSSWTSSGTRRSPSPARPR